MAVYSLFILIIYPFIVFDIINACSIFVFSLLCYFVDKKIIYFEYLIVDYLENRNGQTCSFDGLN